MDTSLESLEQFFSKSANWISFYSKNSSTKSFQKQLVANIKDALEGKDLTSVSSIKDTLISEIVLAKQIIFKGYLTEKENSFMKNWCLLLYNGARLYELDTNLLCLAEAIYSIASMEVFPREFTYQSINNSITFLIDDLLISSTVDSTKYYSNNYLEEFRK